MLVALYTISDFGVVSLLQLDTFTRAIYLQYQAAFDRSGAALLSLLVVILASLIMALEFRVRGSARYHRSGAGVARPPALIHLGRWRFPALIFCSIVVLLTVILPATVLVYWSARGLTLGLQDTIVWSALINTVYVAGLSAAATTLAAIPISVLAVRHPSRLSTIFYDATYVGFALPGIVVALALVFLVANYATMFYQTLTLLVAAYIIRFLPQAVGATRVSLLQLKPSVEEAARSLGRTSAEVLVTITIPLLRPGISASAALVFLTTMKELPATLLLSPIGFKSLATVVWSATSEGLFARAAPPALLLVLTSGLSAVLLFRADREVLDD